LVFEANDQLAVAGANTWMLNYKKRVILSGSVMCKIKLNRFHSGSIMASGIILVTPH